MEIRPYRRNDEVKDLIRKATESIQTGEYSEEEQQHLEKVIPEMNLDFANKNEFSYFCSS